jgi:acyl carrier protein
MRNLEHEIKQLIIKELNLEDLNPDDIDAEAPLFGDDGLGLDSIDALELGIALQKTYQIQIDVGADNNRQHFASIAQLALFISQHLNKDQPQR